MFQATERITYQTLDIYDNVDVDYEEGLTI